ncbi:MAG: zinc carboxypeptidase [Bdellovibrionales bacterium]|nr:zinc carboxypeptidase [Bdellovibrionales bacterium]
MKSLSAITIGLLLLTSFANANTAAGKQQISKSKSTYHWMKFNAADKYARSKVADLGVTIEAVVEDYVMGLGTEDDLKAAKASGLLETSFPLTPKMLDFPAYDSNFHNYDELTTELEKLAAANPGLVRLSSIGKSLEGRELHLITLSTDGDDMSRPAVFFMGGHHAREHLSVEMALKLSQYLVQQYKSDNPRVTPLLANRTVYIVPLVNPDGAEFDVSAGDYKLWRKNRRNNGSAYGVDLNRNYGFGWGGGGASTSPSNDTYRGPSAFSEPETQAVKQFIDTHDNINIVLTYHTFSALILYPWGQKYEHIETEKDYMVHKTMAETMARWNGYTPQQSSELYIASGDTTDWAYGVHGIISFTFELDPGMSPDKNFDPGKGFYPGQKLIEPTFRKNVEPALYLLEHSDNPYRVIESTSTAYGFRADIL